MPEYIFKPGERVWVPGPMLARGAAAMDGIVIRELPRNRKTNAVRVRVKLDNWPRPLNFRKEDVNPILEC